MKMKIKIRESNSARIEAVLRRVNTEASSNLITSYAVISNLARFAGFNLYNLLGETESNAHLVGTKACATSTCSGDIPCRIGTQVWISRFPTGWFLTEVLKVEPIRTDGEALAHVRLHITEEQSAIAVGRLENTYSILG